MDENHPAWKLAEATLAVRNGDQEAIDKVIEKYKPSTREFAQAYALCLNTTPFSNSEANRLILNTRLQVPLVEEHVMAQRRMGRTINALTVVLVILTTALVIFGGIDIAPKIHMCGPGLSRTVSTADPYFL